MLLLMSTSLLTLPLYFPNSLISGGEVVLIYSVIRTFAANGNVSATDLFALSVINSEIDHGLPCCPYGSHG